MAPREDFGTVMESVNVGGVQAKTFRTFISATRISSRRPRTTNIRDSSAFDDVASMFFNFNVTLQFLSIYNTKPKHTIEKGNLCKTENNKKLPPESPNLLCQLLRQLYRRGQKFRRWNNQIALNFQHRHLKKPYK